jgi:uncharacterized protein YndB with AHSA1/START domain
MAAQRKAPPKPVKDKLTLTRIFDAPPALVFAAWTEPRHLSQWSAPRGFTIPVNKGELKPGGKWRACMVTPEGAKLWLGGVYRKIVPGKLLVFTHAWEGEKDAPETLVTVHFSEHPRGTKLTFTQTGFGSAESRTGHAGGWKECFDRLTELLAKLQATKPVAKKSHGRRK